jgi:hypothetical protein
MKVTFTAIGLSFEGEVNFTAGDPGRYSGPPENCHPAEPDEAEFESLTVDGNDAMFLLDSTMAGDIESAACEAARAAEEAEAEAARADDHDDIPY